MSLKHIALLFHFIATLHIMGTSLFHRFIDSLPDELDM